MDRYTQDLHKKLQPLEQISEHMAHIEARIDLTVSNAYEAKAASDQLSVKIDKLSLEKAKLDKEVVEVKELLLKRETYSKRENLNFDGVEELEGEKCEQTLRKVIRESLMLDDNDMKIVRCYSQVGSVLAQMWNQ